MRKWIKFVITIVIVVLCIKGYVYIQDQKWLSTHDVILDYGCYSLEDIVQQSKCIVEGTVVKVKDVTVKRVLNIYRDHEGKWGYNIEKYPVTPIKIKVDQMIKGKSLTRTVTYYREYSSQSSVVNEGMELIIALDKNGLSMGGGQGVWTILENNVVGNNMNLEREEAISKLKSFQNE